MFRIGKIFESLIQNNRLILTNSNSFLVHNFGYRTRCLFLPNFTPTLNQAYSTADSSDSTDVSELSIDKRVYKFLEKWDVDKAVDLVVSTRKIGDSSLSGHAVHHLLEQLSEIGEVDAFLRLENLILENDENGHNMVYPETFYFYLAKAYFNSGQLKDGVEYLEEFCNGDYNKENFNSAFTLFAVPILQEFQNDITAIEKFVNKCIIHNDIFPLAVLWKCFVLTGNLERSDLLLERYNTALKQYLPIMMNEICQLKDKVKTNISHETMLRYLLTVPQLRKKKLKILVHRTLLQILHIESDWIKLLEALKVVKDSKVELPKAIVENYLTILRKVMENGEFDLSSEILEELETWSLDFFEPT